MAAEVLLRAAAGVLLTACACRGDPLDSRVSGAGDTSTGHDSGPVGDSDSSEDTDAGECSAPGATSVVPLRTDTLSLPCDGGGWNAVSASTVEGAGYLMVFNGGECTDGTGPPVIRVVEVDSWSTVAEFPWKSQTLWAELGAGSVLGTELPAAAVVLDREEVGLYVLGSGEPDAVLHGPGGDSVRNLARRDGQVDIGLPYYDDVGLVASFQGPLSGDVPFAEASAILHSPTGQASGIFGSILNGVGDVDGDGLDDLVVGGQEMYLLSAVDVVDGGEDSLRLLDVWHDSSERGHGNAGDVDRDGLDDIYVVSQPNNEFQWGVISFVGGYGGPAFAHLTGDPVGSYPGEWVSTAGAIGDNDADGRPEMFVSAIYDAREPLHQRVVSAPDCGTWSIGELGVPVGGFDDPTDFPSGATGIDGFSAVLTWDEDTDHLDAVGLWWR